MANRIWRLLSGVQAKNLTGLEIQKAASATYMDTEAKQDLYALRTVRDTVNVFEGPAFQGWPDSHINYQVTITQNSDASVKPSTVFSAEADASGYVCQLMAATIQGVGDAIQVQANLKDDNSDVTIVARTSGTPASQVALVPSQLPVFFTEDNYLLFTETGNLSNAVLRLVVQIVSRGGNAQ